MLINGYDVVDRNNRPGVLSRVALRTFWNNDGMAQSPYAISSVSIFLLTDNTSPSTILTSSNLVDQTIAVDNIKMQFANSAVPTSDVSFNVSNYTPGPNASGIYKLANGQFAVVLDGTVSLSGVFGGAPIPNTASGAASYIDVWTVKWLVNSPWEIFVQNFALNDDTLFVTTEPLLLTTAHRLSPKRLKMGSKMDLKVATEVHVSNKNITPDIRNVFKDSVITSAQMQITKLNEGDSDLPSIVIVSSYADTSSFIDVTSDNTILLNFDTTQLYTHARLLDGTLGPITGTYIVHVKYTMLNQLIVSERLVFLIE